MRVLACPDKFRGSATAPQVAAAVVRAANDSGHVGVAAPLADGGEGTLDAFGGANRWTRVTGPLGRAVQAGWRLEDGIAIIESAQACGLVVAGDAQHNDPVGATTRGVGELIAAAAAAGASAAVVGVGGSATTDGGRGAADLLESAGVRLGPAGSIRVMVCCDVETPFTSAAAVFGPQKGATPEQITLLTARLHQQRADVLARTGIDLDTLAGSGAAGGLAGGLAALGADIVPGLDTIAERVGLPALLDSADLVVTGEGRLDRTTAAGKVVGGVVRRARAVGLAILVVAGSVEPGVSLGADVQVVDLCRRFGRDRSFGDPGGCVADTVTAYLAGSLA